MARARLTNLCLSFALGSWLRALFLSVQIAFTSSICKLSARLVCRD
jgi:hypothetical protein